MSADITTNADELILSSRRVVTFDGERPATLIVQDGIIVEVAKYDPQAGEDFGHLAILPGLVDPHVHLNEPGRTEWEGFATGTAAAAAGGITTLVDMPLNSSPVTTTLAGLQEKQAAATGKLRVDVGFYAGLVPGKETEIAGLLDAGVLGVKAFLCHSGIDEFPAATEKELRAVMPLLAERGVPLLVHAELESATPTMSDPRRYADYLATRPPKFEREAIELLIALCRETGCRTHVVHLADAECLAPLQAARDEGLPLTVETCPHYLTFAAEEISDGATQYKCAPPIRDATNREGLWHGLSDGVIDFIATDHSPCPPAMKQLETGRFDLAWGGISSLQLSLSAIWTEAAQRGHTLMEVAGWMCHRPAKFLGIEAGIQTGRPAHLVVFDPDATFVVHGEDLLHRHPVTPYEGRTLRGEVRRAFLRGVSVGCQESPALASPAKTNRLDGVLLPGRVVLADNANADDANAGSVSFWKPCCGATWWCERMAEMRPAANATAWHVAADDAFDAMPRDAWLEAFASHPKIGDLESLRMKLAGNKQWSAGEQAGVNDSDEATLKHLAKGNHEYEERFGYVFIICATGLSAAEMLEQLQQRLKNDDLTEFQIACAEQRKITHLRLDKHAPPTETTGVKP